MKIELDMYQTLALSVLVLLLGKFLRERVRMLEKFCIPAPVIGGVLFAILPVCATLPAWQNSPLTTSSRRSAW